MSMSFTTTIKVKVEPTIKVKDTKKTLAGVKHGHS